MRLNDDNYKEFQEQNFILQDEEKGVICKVTCEKQRLTENYKLKSNAIVNDVQDRKGEAVQLWDVIPDRRLQPQESMVCWERFLHLRSLKVLLVENDDSTRHIVSALLRNCSYEVIEAANGLQAWKILEDLSNHIDLILTEVVMPCFSGIGLLCKLMNHKTRNNIPVIMMSSHDSMGLVFKCLSKGAVDFLVKPVRKNELKILWQHVWRRCHTSSGSRSESGTQTQKSVKSKSVRNIGNNIGSDDREDNKTNLNIEDDSGNESGTQGSWTKQIVEVESSRDVSECADSTCAQVVRSNEKAFGDHVPLPPTTEFQEQNNRQDSVAMFDEGMIIPPKNLDFELDLSNEVSIKHVSVKQKNTVLEMGINKFNEQLNNELLKLNSGSTTNKLKCENVSLKGLTSDIIDPQMDNSVSTAPNEHLKISHIMNKAASDSDGPSPEPSLKRLRGAADYQNVTRRSESTSFSRYNAASNFNQALTVQVESSSPCEISPDIQSNSSGNPPNQSSNGDSNNVDMGSITINAFTKLNTMNEYSVVAPTIHGLQVSPGSKSMKEDKISTPEQILLDNCDDMAPVILQAQSKDIKSLRDSHVRHLLHQQALPSEHGDLSLKKMAVTLTHCGSNLDGPMEGNASNFSVDRSGSGSNPDNNGQNGKIRPKRKERCTRKEEFYFVFRVHHQNRKRHVGDLDSGDTRRKFSSKNTKEAGDD